MVPLRTRFEGMSYWEWPKWSWRTRSPEQQCELELLQIYQRGAAQHQRRGIGPLFNTLVIGTSVEHSYDPTQQTLPSLERSYQEALRLLIDPSATDTAAVDIACVKCICHFASYHTSYFPTFNFKHLDLSAWRIPATKLARFQQFVQQLLACCPDLMGIRFHPTIAAIMEETTRDTIKAHRQQTIAFNRPDRLSYTELRPDDYQNLDGPCANKVEYQLLKKAQQEYVDTTKILISAVEEHPTSPNKSKSSNFEQRGWAATKAVFERTNRKLQRRLDILAKRQPSESPQIPVENTSPKIRWSLQEYIHQGYLWLKHWGAKTAPPCSGVPTATQSFDTGPAQRGLPKKTTTSNDLLKTMMLQPRSEKPGGIELVTLPVRH